MTEAQWLLEYYALLEREEHAREERLAEFRRAENALINVLGNRLRPPKYDEEGELIDDGVIGLALLTGNHEVMRKVLEGAAEAEREDAAGRDETFDAFSEDVRRAAAGLEPLHREAAPVARLLTEDHTERERTAGARAWVREKRRAGIADRPPAPPPLEAAEAPDAADRARAGVPPPAPLPREAEGGRFRVGPERTGGLEFDPEVGDLYAAYAANKARAGETLMSEEEARKRADVVKRPQATLEELTFDAGLDPATAPLGAIAAALGRTGRPHGDGG